MSESFEPKCPKCGKECDVMMIFFNVGDMSTGCSNCQIFSKPIHVDKAMRMRIAKEVFGTWADLA